MIRWESSDLNPRLWCQSICFYSLHHTASWWLALRVGKELSDPPPFSRYFCASLPPKSLCAGLGPTKLLFPPLGSEIPPPWLHYQPGNAPGEFWLRGWRNGYLHVNIMLRNYPKLLALSQ